MLYPGNGIADLRIQYEHIPPEFNNRNRHCDASYLRDSNYAVHDWTVSIVVHPDRGQFPVYL